MAIRRPTCRKHVEAYSQAQAADDIVAVMDAAGIERAHLVGLSMGGFAVLHAGLRHPARVRSIVAAGAGYGAEKAQEEYFRGVSAQVAANFEARGAAAFAPVYAEGASRVQFQAKDPRGWALFAERLGQHDARGAANTMRGVQMRRPSLYDLEAEFRAMQAPLLVMVGDEDDHCLQPGLFLKRIVRRAGLAVFPKSGHTLNLEEPALFNQLLAEFIAQVEGGALAGSRSPRQPGAGDADRLVSMRPSQHVDGGRLWQRLMDLAAFGARPDGGVDRQALTADGDRRARGAGASGDVR